MDDRDDLGPVIAVAGTNHAMAITLGVFGALLIGMGVLAGLKDVSSWGVVASSGAVGVLLILVGLGLYWSHRGLSMTLHERGLRRFVGGRATALRFDDADRVGFATTRHYANGVYVGTVERLTLISDGPEPVRLFFQRRFHDPKETAGPTDAARVVQPVIRRIGGRLAERLGRGESVPWFPGATIHDWGVEVPNGWGGQRPIRWEELDAPEIVRGFCRLRVVGKKSPVAAVNCGLPNFFPGLELVESRRARAGGGR